MKMYSTLIIVIIVLIGMIFMGCKCKSIKEGFGTNSCPNILIQKGSAFYLYNSKRAKVPGVNPIHFNTLEDYVEFIKWQRSQGIRCPVLYLQQTYDTQGNEKYMVRTDSELNTVPPEFRGAPTLPPETLLLDATRTDPPYNQDHYPSFDPMNQYIGLNTPLDKMFNESYNGVSPNPMDTNWGGDNYTQDLIDKGFYKNREVNIYAP
jgi:hypothetical protein